MLPRPSGQTFSLTLVLLAALPALLPQVLTCTLGRQVRHLLDLFDLKLEEGLASMTRPSPMVALRFFEETCELPRKERLSLQPADDNAVKDHTLTAEVQAAANDGEKKKK